MTFWEKVFAGSQGLEPIGWVIRTVIMYIALLFMVRLLGQREVGQLTAFDFIVAITVGSIVSNALTDANTSLWEPLLTTAVFLSLYIINAVLSVHNQFFGRLTTGEPVVLIKDGRVQENALRKGRLNIDDLMTGMRNNNVFNLSDVELAILEPTGKINVKKSWSKQTVTRGDILKNRSQSRYPAFLVREGRIIEKNLRSAGLSESWLRDQIAKLGVDRLQDVFVAQISDTGTLYVDIYDDRKGTLQLDIGKDLVLTQLKSLSSQFENFSLDTDDSKAQEMYRSLAKKAEKIYADLSRIWAHQVKLKTHFPTNRELR